MTQETLNKKAPPAHDTIDIPTPVACNHASTAWRLFPALGDEVDSPYLLFTNEISHGDDPRKFYRNGSLYEHIFVIGRSLEHPPNRLPTRSDAPFDAVGPNAGFGCWLHSRGHVWYNPSGNVLPHLDRPHPDTMAKFHAWGFCIWDLERLRRWDMLEGLRGPEGRWSIPRSRWYADVRIYEDV